MGFWWWVLIFAGIGLAALVLYTLLGLSLWRKAKLVTAELGRISALADRAAVAMRTAGRPTGAGPSGDDPVFDVDEQTPAVHGRRHA